MLRCRKCAYSLSDGPEPPERCPNCGTPTRAPEPERPLPVALGTVWRRAGAGESDPDPRPPVPAAARAFGPPPGLFDRRGLGPVAPPAPGARVPPLPGLPIRPRGEASDKAGTAPVPGDSNGGTGVSGAAAPGSPPEPGSVLDARHTAPIDRVAVAPGPENAIQTDTPAELPPVPRDRRFVARRDATHEPDDLPAPVASSRPFTIPKVVRRIKVPAMTAVPSDLESSSELDLPQLGSLSASGLIETIVAPTRAPGRIRPDDVELDIDDLRAIPTPSPQPPAPTASASASGSAGRGSLRAPRPRPLHRLVPVVPQPEPPALAYVGLGALVLAFAGLWWFYFERGPGPRVGDPGASDMSLRTWPEGYIAAQDARLDADRVSEYRAALAEAETHADPLGRAEAALCMHLRYGPDPILRSAAAVWRKQAGSADPRADRVGGLALLAAGAVAEAETLLSSQDDARARLYRALAAQQRGDHEAAARAAREALELRPGDAAATLVGLTATLAARRDTPLTELQHAATARPDHPLYQQALLRALLARGRLHAARSLADQQRPVPEASDVHNAQVLVLQAEVAAAGGEARKARDLADSARSLAPQHLPTQLAQVRLLLATGDPDRAQIELTPLLRASEDSEALVLQAELAIGAGNESAATRAVDRLAALDDLDAAQRRQLTVLRGRLHVMRGRSDDAAAVFTAVLAESPDASAAIALAQLRVRIGAADPLASIVATEARLREDPRESVRAQLRALRLAHANLLFETGRKDQAVAVLDAALLADPDDNAAQLRRGVLAIEQGRSAAGRADLLAVFDRTGGYPGLIGPLGRMYLREGDLSQLGQLLSPYAEDPQASDEVVVMHALLRLAQGDRDAADQHIDKVLQRSPSSWEAHLAKARVLYERERISEAAAEIRLARPKVADAEVELWTAKIAERAGKPQDALAALRRARQLDPGQLEAGYLLGRTLLAQGLAREAVIELQAVTRAPQAPAGAHLALGLAFREREQLPEALQSFTRAINLEPNPEEALYWAGRTAVELGRPAEGVPHLGRAVLASAGTSWLPDAHLWLGRALHRTGHQSEARVALTRYLQLAGPKAPARAEVEKLLRPR